jgi:hypothetical protein
MVAGRSRCDHIIEVVKQQLEAITVDLALSLGLVRVVTLLPFHDPSLDEVERSIAHAWEATLELRRRLEELEHAAPEDRDST